MHLQKCPTFGVHIKNGRLAEGTEKTKGCVEGRAFAEKKEKKVANGKTVHATRLLLGHADGDRDAGKGGQNDGDMVIPQEGEPIE